tara:strand:+ start:140 stop:490 length:351 start_codon:yes stop_codon:yes gene_type:complete
LNIFLSLIISTFLFFFNPASIYSAEILQINNSNSILIGDQNRNLSINLVCANVDLEDENAALDLLRTKFPRGTKVKIKPYGFKGSNLQAKIYKLDENIEMNQLLKTYNLSNEVCDN